MKFTFLAQILLPAHDSFHLSHPRQIPSFQLNPTQQAFQTRVSTKNNIDTASQFKPQLHSSSTQLGTLDPELDEFNPRKNFFLLVVQSQFVTLSLLLNYIFPSTPPLDLQTLVGTFTTPQYLLHGLLATVPLIILVFSLSVIEGRVPALKKVSESTEGTVLALLGSKRRIIPAVLTSLALGIVAGLGEEAFFRQILVLRIGLFCPMVLANLISSTVFALGHAVTKTYAIIAFVVSLYFGFLFLQYDFTTAFLAHAFYDAFAVFWCHVKITKSSGSSGRELRDSLRQNTPTLFSK